MGKSGKIHPNVPTSPRRLTAELKKERILQLRLRGHSIREIAREVGMHPRSVWRALMAVYQRIPAEDIDMARRLELERLDRATILVMQRIEEGDLTAIDRLIRLADLRMRIVGGYQTQTVDLNQPIQLVWPDGNPVSLEVGGSD